MQDIDDDERDHPQAMIDWLADKDPDVWFEVSKNLNWDSAEGVLEWIVSQPRCDRANAALIFWRADPAYYAKALAAGETPRDHFYPLVQAVLHRWKTGFYTRAELALDEADSGAERYRMALAGQRDPLALPVDLLAPLRGRKPRVPRALQATENAELWDLFYGLGTQIGARPGTNEGRKQRSPLYLPPAEMDRRRAAIRREVGETLRFYARSAKWLALFFVVAMAAAFTLRYLHKGVVF